MNATEFKGKKADEGKQEWFAMPISILKPLSDAFVHGECEYGLFNCLNEFDDPSRRFYNSMIRHIEESQIDPLAVDSKSGVPHLACVAFNALMRLHHCQKEAKNGNRT